MMMFKINKLCFLVISIISITVHAQNSNCDRYKSFSPDIIKLPEGIIPRCKTTLLVQNIAINEKQYFKIEFNNLSDSTIMILGKLLVITHCNDSFPLILNRIEIPPQKIVNEKYTLTFNINTNNCKKQPINNCGYQTIKSIQVKNIGVRYNIFNKVDIDKIYNSEHTPEIKSTPLPKKTDLINCKSIIDSLTNSNRIIINKKDSILYDTLTKSKKSIIQLNDSIVVLNSLLKDSDLRIKKLIQNEVKSLNYSNERFKDSLYAVIDSLNLSLMISKEINSKLVKTKPQINSQNATQVNNNKFGLFGKNLLFEPSCKQPNWHFGITLGTLSIHNYQSFGENSDKSFGGNLLGTSYQ